MEKTPAANSQLDFSTDTDADLLGYMTMKADAPEVAKEAWGEFYQRHIKYLYGVLRRRAGDLSFVSEDLVENLTQDTFIRAYERAETFNDRGISNREELRRLARGWLGSIARNLLYDHGRKCHKDTQLEDLLRDEDRRGATKPQADSFAKGLFGMTGESEAIGAAPTTEAQLATEAYEEVLNDREREVLRVTAEFHKPGEEFQRLPSGVAERLADLLDTSTANLRVIRLRARQKIRGYVEKRLKERQHS